MNDHENIIYEVTAALAAAENTDPRELEYSLSDYVDPELLLSLAEMNSTFWSFRFKVADHEILVCDTGEVYIDEEIYRGDVPVDTNQVFSTSD